VERAGSRRRALSRISRCGAPHAHRPSPSALRLRSSARRSRRPGPEVRPQPRLPPRAWLLERGEPRIAEYWRYWHAHLPQHRLAPLPSSTRGRRAGPYWSNADRPQLDRPIEDQRPQAIARLDAEPIARSSGAFPRSAGRGTPEPRSSNERVAIVPRIDNRADGEVPPWFLPGWRVSFAAGPTTPKTPSGRPTARRNDIQPPAQGTQCQRQRHTPASWDRVMARISARGAGIAPALGLAGVPPIKVPIRRRAPDGRSHLRLLETHRRSGRAAWAERLEGRGWSWLGAYFLGAAGADTRDAARADER